MRYPHILAAIRSAKWAVTEPTLQAIRDALSARLTGQAPDARPRAGDWYGDDDSGDDDECDPFEMIGLGVACVEMHGIIGRKLSSFEMMCGGCDIAVIEQRLTIALASPMVRSVILDIDSPGGVVGGVAEFAAKIGELIAESGKPVYAFASGQCCSAAYWIACGCSGIIGSTSSDIGSIGVYMALVDESDNWAKEGYRLVLVKAGENKAAGIAGSKITPEQIALWQADVDFVYAQFTDAVKAARPGIADATMQGQTFYGARAKDALLVDDVVSDIETLAEQLAVAA